MAGFSKMSFAVVNYTVRIFLFFSHSKYVHVDVKANIFLLHILSIFIYLNFNYLVSVTAGGPVSPRGHM